MNYEDFEGTYAFVMNRQGPTEREITDAQVYEICNRELNVLKELGVLPDSVKNVEPSAYSAVLYSAIDVLEPQNNMPVWRVSLSTSQQNLKKANQVIDLYLDADGMDVGGDKAAGDDREVGELSGAYERNGVYVG